MIQNLAFYKIDRDALIQKGNVIERLKRLLQSAMHVELATIPPYLTALFSIKEDTNAAASRIIRGVVMEEMLHMTLAGNVLIALGGRPDLTNPNLIPRYPGPLPHSDDTFIISLEKFSQNSLETFCRIELPEEPKAPPQDDHFHTIGQFYTAVEILLEYAVETYGEQHVFCGDIAHQITPELYYGGSGRIVIVKDLSSALAAINEIKIQGEGAHDSIWEQTTQGTQDLWLPAHYFRFKELIFQQCYAPGDKPNDHPTGQLINVDFKLVHNIAKNPKSEDYRNSPELADANFDFNKIYSRLLRDLQKAFSGEPQHLAQSVGRMYQMKYLAQTLMNIAYPDKPGYQASPTFEWVEDKSTG